MITSGKYFFDVIIGLLITAVLMVLGFSAMGDSGFAVLFVFFVSLFIGMVVSSWITKSFYKRIQAQADELAKRQIKEFLHFSMREDKQLKGHLAELSIPIFDTSNKESGSQGIYGYLLDKLKEFEEK